MEALKTQTIPKPKVLPNLMAVASGKGGVGKTWLSITLCHALARAGRQMALVDGDLGLANVDIQLGLNPQKDLAGVLADRYPLSDARMTCADGGFDVYAGRSGSSSLASLPAERLNRLTASLATLAPMYQQVMLDLGAGIERTVRHLALQAKTCLVVTTDEPTALTDAYAFIKLSLRQTPDADLRIVINMADSPSEGKRTYATLRKACESFLKITPPLAGVIRTDSRVKDTIRHQTPFLTRHPTAEAAEDVEALARRLLE
jgi:flagellar biosynthesis protein FlhG